MGADESATSDLVSILCDHFTDTFPGDPQTEANVIFEMQAKIATLESKLSICQMKKWKFF